MRGSLLWRRRNLHPVVLALLDGDAVALAVVELAAQPFVAVEAHCDHFSILEHDDAFLVFMMSQEGKVLKEIAT